MGCMLPYQQPRNAVRGAPAHRNSSDIQSGLTGGTPRASLIPPVRAVARRNKSKSRFKPSRERAFLRCYSAYLLPPGWFALPPVWPLALPAPWRFALPAPWRLALPPFCRDCVRCWGGVAAGGAVFVRVVCADPWGTITAISESAIANGITLPACFIWPSSRAPVFRSTTRPGGHYPLLFMILCPVVQMLLITIRG